MQLGLQILVLATILNVIGLLINGLVIVVASKARSMLVNNGQVQKFAQCIMGFVFVGLAGKLALEGQR